MSLAHNIITDLFLNYTRYDIIWDPSVLIHEVLIYQTLLCYSSNHTSSTLRYLKMIVIYPYLLGATVHMHVRMCMHACSPYASHVSQVTLREGDLVIAATDGLYSNLYPRDIIAHLKRLKVRQQFQNSSVFYNIIIIIF